MMVDGCCPPKRRKPASFDSMDSTYPARAKFAESREKFGRELRVFETSPTTPTQSPATDNIEKYLKTKKIGAAEEAARRSRTTKLPADDN